MPVVSVLMTAYNREPYIAAAIESVLASSFRDFELHVVDDGSRDRTPEIAESYAARDARVRVHRNPRNLGDYPNRNRAAALASGRYLKYVDSDDVLYPHTLGLMVDAARTAPDAALVISRPLEDDQQPYPLVVSAAEAYRRHYLGGGLLDAGPSGVLIDRERFGQAGGFSSMRLLGDLEAWLRLAARWPVVLVGPGMVWWRRHEGQETASIASRTTYSAEVYRVLLAALHSPACPLSADDTRLAIGRIRRNVARAIIAGTVKGRHPAVGWRALRSAELSLGDLLSAVLPAPVPHRTSGTR